MVGILVGARREMRLEPRTGGTRHKVVTSLHVVPFHHTTA